MMEAAEKPREGDVASMLHEPEDFFYIDRAVKKRGEKWLVEDDYGEDHWVVRDEGGDTSQRKAWKEVKAGQVEASGPLDDPEEVVNVAAQSLGKVKLYVALFVKSGYENQGAGRRALSGVKQVRGYLDRLEKQVKDRVVGG